MTNPELNWMAGGPQGSGVDTAANIFGRACGYGGYHLYGRREYHSNIKGLHSYFHFRVSQRPVAANVNDVDLLAAFDAETVFRHIQEVVPNGAVVLENNDLGTKFADVRTLPPEYSEELQRSLESRGIGNTVGDLAEAARKDRIAIYPVPFSALLKDVAEDLGIQKLSKVARMKNVLALGVTFALLGYEVGLVERAISSVFAKKPEVARMNILAHKKAYDYAKRTFGEASTHKLKSLDLRERRLFLSGNQAVALGKVLGGCRIQTYYPITPAADESEYLEAHEVFDLKNGDGGIVVMQTEDEIAAINMASGAALTGVRAATSTSGPGFSLMAEGLSWAGNNEVPIVVTYYQRAAPSTGLPTRHGQDDLRFAVHAGHGEYPRIVLASGDMRECFYDAAKAFNYAEKYQLPVIHLIDKAIANTTQSYIPFDLSSVKIERGKIAPRWNPQGGKYRRFELTSSGISTRAFLGVDSANMWYTGDEHNELGHVTEDPLTRVKMMEKRMNKLELIDKEIPVRDRLNTFGPERAKNVVVSWGSPKGAILEAMEILRTEGHDFGFVQVRMPHPLPARRITEILQNAGTSTAVEMNFSGQLADIIREKTGILMDYRVVKYNGRPMTTTEVLDALRQIAEGEALRRQVLTYGS
jgi:2-oxoglutarate ferredoxin oxidoreductase subunit alpha